MKCGYVAVLGQSNAGKSSLVNFLVGEEVAIVSHRRQTTRNSILGIKNGVFLGEDNIESNHKKEAKKGEAYQIVFVDTPGIHHSKNNLDKFMMKNVRSAIAGADVVLYLYDGSKVMDEEENEYIENLRGKIENLILVQTKSDKKQVVHDFDAICVSVVNGQNMQTLERKIVELLPEGQAIYDEDLYTDKSISFLISEKVRGLLLENFDKEIPHGVAIVITSFEEDDAQVKIDAEIVCEREQHKGIIIGKGGVNLKKIGALTREYAENLLGKKCVLKLFVKVDKDWRNKNVGEYGYF